MIRSIFLLTATGLAAATMLVGADGATPFQNGERLRYEVVWPSGLSLGEAEFSADSDQSGWTFDVKLSANLPTFEIRDEHHATTDWELCSLELDKKSERGNRKTHEKVEFDQAAGTVHRESVGGGGASDYSVPPCARDALTYLYFLRWDLARGRVPPPDDVVFGASYAVAVTYAETRKLEARGGEEEADRILVDTAGPDSQHSFEIFFSKDESRTPLLIRVPFELGTFALRLVE